MGADGVNSTVARLVGAAKYHEAPAGRLFMWAYFEDGPADGHLRLGAIGDHGFLAFPTDAGLFMAATVPSIERRDEVLADRESVHASELAHWPELDAALAGAKRVGPVRVMTRDGFFRVRQAWDGSWSAMLVTSRTLRPARASLMHSDKPSSSGP